VTGGPAISGREPTEQPAPDSQRVYEAVERAVLGSARTLNRVEVARRAGVPLERATALWQALGFAGVSSDDAVLFVDADVEALSLVDRLVRSGLINPEAERTLVRSLGRSFARLAEWEVAELAATGMAGAMAGRPGDPTNIERRLEALVPEVERLHSYVWRRHVASVVGRVLLRPRHDEGVPLAVGFADIVGYTRRSRALRPAELAALVESFESVSAAAVTGHGGRVVKTIGDEVLFVADEPADAARIGLTLVEARAADERFPEMRVGLAYGDVVSRLGDVFGPVVNIAARLTSVARPGRVLVDRELRDRLKPMTEEFRVRRSRTTTVRGYAKLDSWVLARARQQL
jgi:adenylate cyclase